MVKAKRSGTVPRQSRIFCRSAAAVRLPAKAAACRRILEFGTSIEFEFESSILNAREGSGAYRERFRDYMRGARRYGIYGTQPLAYYHGTNALVLLSQSQSAVDRELYHEFCQFVLNNPLRAENTGK